MAKTFVQLRGPSRKYPHGSIEVAKDFDSMDAKARRLLLRTLLDCATELTERNNAELMGVRITDPNPSVVARIVRRGRRAIAAGAPNG